MSAMAVAKQISNPTSQNHGICIGSPFMPRALLSKSLGDGMAYCSHADYDLGLPFDSFTAACRIKKVGGTATFSTRPIILDTLG